MISKKKGSERKRKFFYRCFCLLEQMKFYENLFKIGKEDDLNFMILSKQD